MRNNIAEQKLQIVFALRCAHVAEPKGSLEASDSSTLCCAHAAEPKGALEA